ncbi:MAG: hypothetical protein VX730_01230 [Pseudomonadota bacterium]|nr:hypothetical protein [Pseudomonadota bacterium]
MKSYLFILAAAAGLLFLAGVPFATILLFLGLIVFVWFGVTKLGNLEQRPIHDTFGGQTIEQHIERWDDHIRRCLPNHPKTYVQTYGVYGNALYPIMDKDEEDKVIGYQVDFLIFNVRNHAHTHREGRLSFLDAELNDTLNTAYQFWEEVDRLTEELSKANSDLVHDEVLEQLKDTFFEMYYNIYPDERPTEDETPE